jgi:hypothetical protein
VSGKAGVRVCTVHAPFPVCQPPSRGDGAARSSSSSSSSSSRRHVFMLHWFGALLLRRCPHPHPLHQVGNRRGGPGALWRRARGVVGGAGVGWGLPLTLPAPPLPAAPCFSLLSRGSACGTAGLVESGGAARAARRSWPAGLLTCPSPSILLVTLCSVSTRPGAQRRQSVGRCSGHPQGAV